MMLIAGELAGFLSVGFSADLPAFHEISFLCVKTGLFLFSRSTTNSLFVIVVEFFVEQIPEGFQFFLNPFYGIHQLLHAIPNE